jgi:uncharacterized protein YbaA (DUF1428 family)
MSDDEVRGMTVNERLTHFGLVADFDAAVRARDADAVVVVLRRAQFLDAQVRATAQAVLANPRFYGF